MKVTSLFFGALAAVAMVASAPAGSQGGADPAAFSVAWEAPSVYVGGDPFEVSIAYAAGPQGAELENWRVSAGAFMLGDEPLAERQEGSFMLPPGGVMTVSFDISAQLAGVSLQSGFNLACEGSDRREVKSFMGADRAINFIDPAGIATKDLADYKVLMTTTQGDMLMNMYPHLAPNHVRNFLDLNHTGFYEGVQFHRVVPGFMIQGGDPTGSGSGNGPRVLDAEFSSEPHVPGILSMARTDVPNSASCQFFVMHARYESLDGEYSVFGKLESGFEVVDAMVKVPCGAGNRPLTPQKIISTRVLYAPSK